MSGPTIRVAADVSAVKRAIDEVVAKTKEATAAASGSIKLNTSEASKQLDGLQQAVDGLQDALGDIGAEIDGTFAAELLQSLRDAEHAATKLEGVLSSSGPAQALTDAAQAAGKLEDALSGNGPANATAGTTANVRRLTAELERARRVQEVLAREGIKLSREQAREASDRFNTWRDSGVRGTRRLRGQSIEDFLGGGWRQVSLNELDARRMRRNVLRAVGLPTGAGGGGGGGEAQGLGAFAFGVASHAVRGVASSAFPVGGPGGAIMRHAAAQAAAAEGGLLSGAGLSRLAVGGGIGALAFAAIKGVQGAASKVGDAEHEGGAYADLARQLGMVASDFNALRDSVRGTTYGLGIAYNEAVKLAQAYAHEAALGPKDRAALAGEVRGAASFSRGFGLDPSRGMGFFAAMRHYGASDGEAGNRRLALMIADAMSRKGDFSRAGEVVDAVHQFVATTTARSMAPANVASFTEFVGRFSGLRMPGIGSSEAAGLVSRLDQGFRAGGGEPGQNFRLAVLQRLSRDVNAMDLQTVAGGGFFATGDALFGKNSPAYKAALANKDRPEQQRLERMARDFGGEPVGVREIRALIEHYRDNGGTAVASSALQGMYGLSAQESNGAIAAVMAGNASLGGLAAKLKAAKLDMSAVSMQNLGLLSSLAGSDRGGLETQAKELLARKGAGELTEKERGALNDSLKSSDVESLRTAVLQAVAGRELLNDGEKTRDSIASLQNVLQDFAGKLVPLTTSIRDAVVGFAVNRGILSKEQAWAQRGVEARAALDVRLKGAAGSEERRRIIEAEITRASADDHLPDSYLKSLREMRFAIPEGTASAPRDDLAWRVTPATGRRSGGARRKEQLVTAPSRYDDLFKRAGAAHGVDPALLKAIAVQESELNPNATNVNVHADGSRSTDRGMFQLNDRYDAERGTIGARALDPEVAAFAAAKHLRSLLNASGDVRTAVRRYNGSGPRAEAYADALMPLYARARAAAEVQPSAAVRQRADLQGFKRPTEPLLPDAAASGAFGLPGAPSGMPAPLPMLSQQPLVVENRITLVDQHGRERHLPAITTVASGPRPAGVR